MEIVSGLDTGVVQWFNSEKGFGFITDDSRGDDVFVTYADIEGTGFRSLDEDQRVGYMREDSVRGPRARAVHPL